MIHVYLITMLSSGSIEKHCAISEMPFKDKEAFNDYDFNQAGVIIMLALFAWCVPPGLHTCDIPRFHRISCF